MTGSERDPLIGPLLKAVSRSFYLTLRVLPPALRPAISLAYLLARASDTIADTKVVPRERRRELLVRFRGQFEHGVNADDLRLIQSDLAPRQSLSAEKVLLEKLGACFEMLATLPEGDQRRIAELLGVITRGQEDDLVKFPGENERELVAFDTDQQLDDYTYAVAGCVGEFWTKMCVAHLPTLGGWNAAEMTALGIRFGRGLQLTNILRDIPKDLRIGRCYIPRERLAGAGLEPAELLSTAATEKFQPIYHRYLDRILEHLDCGWRYMLAIPRTELRLRLACAWPILIGLKTVALLRKRADVLDPKRHIMIFRGKVYWIILKSSLVGRNDAVMEAWYRQQRAEAAGA